MLKYCTFMCANPKPSVALLMRQLLQPIGFDSEGRYCVFLTDCSISFIMLPYKPHRPTDNNAKKKEHEKEIFTKFMLIVTVHF